MAEARVIAANFAARELQCKRAPVVRLSFYTLPHGMSAPVEA